MKILKFIVLIMVAQNAYSQNPGYLGKKWTIGYELDFVNNRKYFNENLSKKKWYNLNKRHQITFEKMASPGNSTVLNLGLFSTVSPNERTIGGVTQYVPINTYTALLSARLYNQESGAIAPYGPFINLGIGYLYAMENPKVNTTINDPSIHHGILLKIAGGKQFFIFKNLLGRFGFNSIWYSGLPKKRTEDEKRVSKRLRHFLGFNFKTGVSLIF